MAFGYFRKFKQLTVLTVYVALFIDNLLLTAIVPILPDLLQDFNANKTNSNLIDYNLGKNSDKLNITLHNNTSRSKQDSDISLYIGIVVGIKSFIQIISNLIVSKIIHRIGYTIPLLSGFIILSLTSLCYVINHSFYMICFTRGLQGIGSALASTSGLGVLAVTYTNDDERSNAMGIAFGGIALGIVLGPVYGSILYEYGGFVLSFGIIAALALIGGFLEIISMNIAVSKNDAIETGVFKLILDYKIAICAGTIAVAIYCLVTVNTTLPIHMLNEWDSTPIVRGTAFLPHYVSYMISTRLVGYCGNKFGRYLISFWSLIILTIAAVLYSFANSFLFIILPGLLLGLAVGTIDTSMFTQLGYIVDMKYSNCYGAVYAIGDIAVCLGATLGPFINGALVSIIGFSKMFWVTGIITLINSILVLVLHKQKENTAHPQK